MAIRNANVKIEAKLATLQSNRMTTFRELKKPLQKLLRLKIAASMMP
jgi:hypothetical protein